MDRFEVARIATQVDQEAYDHNHSPETIAAMADRSDFINNTDNYLTGNITHEVQSRQIASREEWNQLSTIFPIGERGMDFFETPYPHIEQLLGHLDQGYGNAYGDLRISLLREVNHETSIHRAIFMVYVIPHQHLADGDFVFTEYSYGDATHTAICELFDENHYTYIERLTEYEILNFAANHADAAHLMDEYFQDGFVSMLFADDEYNQAQPFEGNQELIPMGPPPPPAHGLDLAYLYLEEIANNPDEDEDFDDNIIPYWLENEERDARG